MLQFRQKALPSFSFHFQSPLLELYNQDQANVNMGRRPVRIDKSAWIGFETAHSFVF
jgi:hypothetical protein